MSYQIASLQLRSSSTAVRTLITKFDQSAWNINLEAIETSHFIVEISLKAQTNVLIRNLRFLVLSVWLTAKDDISERFLS